MNAPSIIVGIMLMALAAGCSGDSACAVDGDCFSGESCVGQICTVADPQSSRDGGQTSDSSITDRDGATSQIDMTRLHDVAVDTADTGTGADSGGEDLGRPDATTDMSCTVDPFTFACTDDEFEPNNTWIDGDNLIPQTVGCNPSFIAHDETYMATMCPLDGSDWYYFRFAPCSDVSYVVEWQLELDSDCDPSVATLEPLSFKCDESFVDCTTVDGKPTIRMIVSQANFQNLQTTYVQVHNNARDDITFEYRISVSVRQ